MRKFSMHACYFFVYAIFAKACFIDPSRICPANLQGRYMKIYCVPLSSCTM